MLLNYKYSVMLLFFIAMLSGCASTSITPGNNVQLKEDEGVLFGVVEHHFYGFNGVVLPTDENYKFSYSLNFGKFDRGWIEKNYDPIKIFSGAIISGNTLSPNNLFVQSLPEGNYSIEEMTLDMGQLNVAFSLPNVDFLVESKKATYIGNIVMDFMPVKNMFGGTEYNLTKVTISDKRDEVEVSYKNKYPELSYEVKSNVVEKSKVLNPSILKNFLKNLGH